MSPDTDYSAGTTPISAATTISAPSPFLHQGRRSPHSSLQARLGKSPAFVPVANFPPPPPPNERLRSTSKSHSDRLLSAVTMRGKGVQSSTQVNAIDTLQENTALALTQMPGTPVADSELRPPNSRRAVSTGDIGLSTSATRSSSNAPSQNIWEPGMPLPPPPPGPPPAGLRSQSLSRTIDYTASIRSPNTSMRNRHPPGRGTGLDTIPPTPADWREDDRGAQGTWPKRPDLLGQLHLDTENLEPSGSARREAHVVINGSIVPQTRQESNAGALVRSPAVRNRSSKGIRERRNESRNGRVRGIDGLNEVSVSTVIWSDAPDSVRPSDLVLPSGSSSMLRRRASTRSTPKSGKNMRGLDEALESAGAKNSGNQASNISSSYSTPRPDSARASQLPSHSTPTPPFSPGMRASRKRTLSGPVLPPKALPTPPLQSYHGAIVSSPLASPPLDSLRPVSHLLHTPVPEVPIKILPLSPESLRSLPDTNELDNPTAFAQHAIERHRKFIESEAAASNDSERLHLFSQYMVAESRIRRDRYAAIFDEEDVDPAELTEGMFEKPMKLDRRSLTMGVHQSPEPLDLSRELSRRSSGTSFSDSPSRNPSTTATSDLVLTLDTSNITHAQGEPSRRNDFVPCLSPIASMSAVTGRDEMDSRGRAPSRWWESASQHSSHEDGFKVLERSKRESKYMGVPPELRNSPALYDGKTSPPPDFSHREEASTSQYPSYHPNEYPPEKSGWQEGSLASFSSSQTPTPRSAPYISNSRKLDISRLVTLPPPFPRHHPAVNNSHPDLADVRAIVRSLHDNQEADQTREAYQFKVLEKRNRADSWCKHQRSLHSQDIQYRMEHGEISQEEFDQAEAEIEEKEAKSERDYTQTAFDLFQNTVVSPLHALYSERIAKASNTFDQLNTRLFSDAQSHSPNLPQEEGDEQPELLEKLTQLKWLFEARESLHRQTYDLLSERNDKYKAVVLLPFQQSHSIAKVSEAESFFDTDQQSRKLAYETAALTRFESFRAVIESHVTRGVEIQLSAFWDIAPPLLSLLQQIPTQDLYGFDIQIPRQELDENPVYWSHPLRYLYSLVSHAESSSRQFIESQVLLWCLLQEVKEAAMGARWRVAETKGHGGWESAERRRMEETALMDDLKDKVGVVEGQWAEALGDTTEKVKESVKEFLAGSGGWDEELEDV